MKSEVKKAIIEMALNSKAGMKQGGQGISFKENDKSVILKLQGYSSHSSVLDDVFKFANENGIKFKGDNGGLSSGEPWIIKFQEK